MACATNVKTRFPEKNVHVCVYMYTYMHIDVIIVKFTDTRIYSTHFVIFFFFCGTGV
jgi:hypothetical protein